MISRVYYLILFLCIFTIAALPKVGFAQNIQLSDVTKIRLAEKWGGASIAGNYFEVINKNGIWKSYRTRIVKDWDNRTKGPYQDSSRVFIKNISPKIINELLSILANPDTGGVVAHYNLNSDSLKKYTDTVHPNLTVQQKSEFVKALQNADNIKEALANSIFILKGNNNGLYQISIDTRTHKTHTASTWNDSFLSYLPWLYSGAYNYNPRILDIFFELGGDTKAAAEHTKRFYVNIDKYIYRKYFETRFNWELFQAENPESYRILNNTITPYKFIVDRHKPNHIPDYRQMYIVHSSRLPDYVNIYWDFYRTDVENCRQLKKYEDTLVSLFHKGNFLFDYLKNRKGARLFVVKGSINGMHSEAKYIYNALKANYKAAEWFDVSQLQFFRVLEADGNMSHWLVFGDKATVLMAYTGDLNAGYLTEFNGITSDPNSTGSHKHSNFRCVVFDKTGKHIWGNLDRVFLGAIF